MKKQFSTAAIFATVAIFDIYGAASAPISSLQRTAARQALRSDLLGTAPGEAFESQATLTQWFYNERGVGDITGMLPEIARGAYLAVKGDESVMPSWLVPHFEGISVQDLIDNNMLPQLITQSFFGNSEITLEFENSFINDLTGLRNIPNIHDVNILSLPYNLITTIDPGEFAGLNSLEVIALNNNKITSIAPGAFADTSALRWLHLFNNNIPEEERPRINAEVRSDATIFWE